MYSNKTQAVKRNTKYRNSWPAGAHPFLPLSISPCRICDHASGLSSFHHYFGLRQISATIESVAHGWARAYHFETRATKEFILFWDIPAIMPLMHEIRWADCPVRTSWHIHHSPAYSYSPMPFHICTFLCLGIYLFTIVSLTHLLSFM